MPIFKGLVPGKDSQVFVLTTLENAPIYIFLKWNNLSLKRRPDAFKYQSTVFYTSFAIVNSFHVATIKKNMPLLVNFHS